MNAPPKYFVFMFPGKGRIRDLLNLAVFCMDPQEKWPAHITVAGPFTRRPRARSQPNFGTTAYSLGAWNFFREGLATVYLKIGVHQMERYWYKPDFLGNPVPHLSLYNGRDLDVGRGLFSRIEALRLMFAFPIHGLDIITSSSQKQFNLRESVNLGVLNSIDGLTIDELATKPMDFRLNLAVEALAQCKQIEQAESDQLKLFD